MSDIPSGLQALVTLRANGRCEYCRLSQVGQEATFHIDHVVPRVAGGETSADNLALACVSCSLRKGAKQFDTDPETGAKVRLFNPRADAWPEHFRWDGVRVTPLSAIGRATLFALDLNRPMILAIRVEEIDRGRHPEK